MIGKGISFTGVANAGLRALVVLGLLVFAMVDDASAQGGGGGNNCTGGLKLCAQISALEDFALGTWAYTGDITLTHRHCVRVSGSNATPGLLYDIALSSVGASGGNLRFTTGPASTLEYEVTYANADGSNSTTITANGGTATGFAGITKSDQSTCEANDASLGQQMTVIVREADLLAATAGAYGGSLQIIVTPQ